VRRRAEAASAERRLVVWGSKSSFQNEASLQGALRDREVRTQGAFVSGGYGRDRGRSNAPRSAARQHKRHFETGSDMEQKVKG
jgi:hypothetical protein